MAKLCPCERIGHGLSATDTCIRSITYVTLAWAATLRGPSWTKDALCIGCTLLNRTQTWPFSTRKMINETLPAKRKRRSEAQDSAALSVAATNSQEKRGII